MEISRLNWSVELDIHAIRQPHPHVNQGGDCGACCLSGILGWGPERIPELYGNVLRPYAGGTPRPIGSVSWGDLFEKASMWMHNTLKAAEPIALDPVRPDIRDWQMDMHNPFATTPWGLADEWIQKLRIYLLTGHVGMTTISFEGMGPYQVRPSGRRVFEGTDHWVLLNGAKHVWEACEGGGHMLARYVRVSCSVKGDYWMRADDFLTLHGGFWVAFIRRLPVVQAVETIAEREIG